MPNISISASYALAEAYGSSNMAEWVKREFGKSEIDRAGAHLVPWWTNQSPAPEELGRAFIIIQNWRTSHAFPLNTFQMGLRKRAKRIQPNALVAQRLKRFSAVMNKLAREPHMKLSQMQDLGGCRAILSSVEAVDRLYELYRREDKASLDSEGTLKCYDYISRPKSDGYRGIHVVGRYSARDVDHEPWNGHRIEIQLRSRLQHAFATAVETVTTFTRTPLKFGGGPDEWRRFFALMGSAMALREGSELVEGTPRDPSELIVELRETANALKVRQRLQGWTSALHTLPSRNIKGFKWLLLVLDVSANKISVTGYADRQKASEAVAEIEQSKRMELDAVLVWVNSIKKLRAAYPNYYADTTEFLDALTIALKPAT